MKAIKVITLFFNIFSFSFLCGQNVGINTPSPKTTLDINGDLALNYDKIYLSGVNTVNLNLKIDAKSFYFVDCYLANSIIEGIAGGKNGRILVLINISNFNINLKHNSSIADSPNKIISNFDKDIELASQGVLMLIYDGTSQLWRQMANGGSNNSKWLTTGNGNLSLNDFLGTVNSQDLILKTFNQPAIKINTDQKMIIGKNPNTTNNTTQVLGAMQITEGNLKLKHEGNTNEMWLNSNGVYSNNGPTLLNKDAGSVGINLNGALPSTTLDVNGTGYFDDSVQVGAHLEVKQNLSVGNNLYAYNRTIRTPVTFPVIYPLSEDKNNLLPIAWGKVNSNGQPDPNYGSRNFNVEHNSASDGYEITVPGYKEIVVILTNKTGAIHRYIDDPSTIVEDIFGDGGQSINSTLVFFVAYGSSVGNNYNTVKAYQYQKGGFVSPEAAMSFEFVAFGVKINP